MSATTVTLPSTKLFFPSWNEDEFPATKLFFPHWDENENARAEEAASLAMKYDPKDEFSRLKVIDRTVWEALFGVDTLSKYGLSFEGDALESKNIKRRIAAIEAQRAAIANVNAAVLEQDLTRTDPGITAITLPKGFSFSKLVAMTGEPINGTPATFQIVGDSVSKNFKNSEVSKTHRVVVTNAILQGSRDANRITQRNLIDKIDDATVIGTLEASILTILTRMSSPEKAPVNLFPVELKPYQRNTYTRTDEGFRIGSTDYHGPNIWRSDSSYHHGRLSEGAAIMVQVKV